MTNKLTCSASLIVQEKQTKAARWAISHPLEWRTLGEPELSVGKGVGLLQLP